jgi:hypothetical protein
MRGKGKRNLIHMRGKLILLVILATLMFVNSARAYSTDVETGVDFFSKYVESGASTTYGTVLSLYKPYTNQWFIASLSSSRQMMARFSTAVNVVSKVAEGRYDEAAVDVALRTIQEIAGSELGKSYMASLGISMPYLNFAVMTAKIYMASVRAVNESTRAVQLESLYGHFESIANNPRLRNPNRVLGEGDPIPVTHASIDLLWKDIVESENVRAQFRVYVCQLLQRDWPDESYWLGWYAANQPKYLPNLSDQENLSYSQPKDTQVLTAPSPFATPEQLAARKKEMEGYIASLLGDLNKKRKVEEQLVLVRQSFIDLKDRIGRSRDLEAIMVKFAEAMGRLPELEEFGKKCPGYIQNAENIRSQRSLEDLMEQSKGFAENVIQFIPAKGIYAKDRARLLGLLKTCYIQAKEKIPVVARKQKEEMEKPAPRPAEAKKDEKIQDGYAYYFKALVVPYAWSEEPDTAKRSVFVSLSKGKWDQADDVYARWTGKTYYGYDRGSGQTYVAHYSDVLTKVTDLYNKTRKPLAEQLLAAQNSCDAAYRASFGPRDACYAAAKTEKDKRPCQDIESRASNAYVFCQESSVRPLRLQIEVLDTGFSRAKQAVGYLLEGDESLYRETKVAMDESFRSILELQQEKKKQLETLRKDLAKFDGRLPLEEKPRVLEGLDRAIADLKKNSWPGVTKEWMGGGGISSSSVVIDERALSLRERARPLPGSVDSWEAKIIEAEEGWNFAVHDWQAFYPTVDLKKQDYEMMTMWVDKTFSRDDFDRYDRAAQRVPALVYSAKMKLGEYRTFAGTEFHNISTDAAWLSSITAEFNKWVAQKQKAGIPYFSYSPGLHLLSSPYPHYLTKGEAALFAAEAKQLKIYDFVRKYMPSSLAAFDAELLLGKIRLAGEENFIICFNAVAGNIAIYKSQISRANDLLASLKPDMGAVAYGEVLKEISTFLPLTLERSNEAEDKAREKIAKSMKMPYVPLPWEGRLIGVDESKLNFPLGLAYLDLRKQISVAIKKGQEYTIAERAKAAEKNGQQEQAKKESPNNAEVAPLPAVSAGRDKEEIQDFYNRFKQAYEERNDSQVLSMISDQWQAGDGATLSDLQMNLRRTFKMFDEVKYNMQNLSMRLVESGNGYWRYLVSYDVTIKSRIYKRNLKHEEKSSINEEVTIDRSGKPKISKTLGGRFWYVQ